MLKDADGSLLVVDTGGWYKLCCPTSQLWKPDVLGGIYRVRRNNAPKVEDPRGLKIDWAKQTVPQLWDLLGDARPAVRLRAARAFAKLGDSAELSDFLAKLDASDILAGNVADGCDQLTADLARTWALISLENAASQPLVRNLLNHANPRIRQAALHGVSLHRDAVAAPQVFALLADNDPAVRRVAAEACGRLADPAAIPHLLQAAATAEDRILQHSITYALIELADPNATRAALPASSPAQSPPRSSPSTRCPAATLRPATCWPALTPQIRVSAPRRTGSSPTTPNGAANSQPGSARN